MSGAKRQDGVELWDLTNANPTQNDIWQPTSQHILEPLTHVEALAYHPHPPGLECARKAVCAYYADQVVITASTSDAYSLLFKLLMDPGDTVLVPRPCYPLFDFLAQLDGIETAPYTANCPVSLNHALDGGARAAIVVHPNNPTGTYVRREERA